MDGEDGSRRSSAATGLTARRLSDGLLPGWYSVQVEDRKGAFEGVPETTLEVRAGETADGTVDLVGRK